MKGWFSSTYRNLVTPCILLAIAWLALPSTLHAQTVEWRSAAEAFPPGPPPKNFTLLPAIPAANDTVIFFAPTPGEGGFNVADAESRFGAPLISIDPTNFVINITFTPPLTNIPIPGIVDPASGVDGQFGPLGPGPWIFKILGNSYRFTVTPTIEWHTLGQIPPESPPTHLELVPATPSVNDFIRFIAPTPNEGGFNADAAEVAFGVPLLSVDSTNHIIAVTFTPPLTNIAIPEFVLPASGVDGEVGPLNPGKWTFTILSNSYAFNVTGPAITAAKSGSSLHVYWQSTDPDYVLQTTSSLSPANWSDVTNDVFASFGTNFSFGGAITNHPGYFRLRHK